MSPYLRAVPLNSLSFGLRLVCMMWVCNAFVRFGGIVRVLVHPCFAVLGLIALRSVSMSFTSSACSSVGRMPVSLLSHRLSEGILPEAAISLLSCSSVGSFGIFCSGR